MMATWPPYGSNFSSGTTDAIGVLVETYNDLEIALQFILLTFMRGDWLSNHIVVEQMSSTAVVEAIKAYLMASKKKKDASAGNGFRTQLFRGLPSKSKQHRAFWYGMAKARGSDNPCHAR